MNKQETLLSLNAIRFSPEAKKIILDDISLSIKDNQKIGLVGKNGAGKTTLLKIIAGNIKPTKGSLKSNCQAFYLPQIDLNEQKSEKPIYNYLERKKDEWWEVIEFLETNFDLSLDYNQKIKNLSGGEFIKLNLALCFVSPAELLLLDEPSNHLDILGLKQLERILIKLKKSYIIVSHNAFFLNKVTKRIWELEAGRLKEYGFGYYDYKEEKEIQKKAKQRKYLYQTKRLKKLKKSQQRETERAERSFGTDKKLRHSGPKGKHDRGVVRGNYFLNRAQKKAGKIKLRLEKREEEIKDKIELFRQPQAPAVFLNLKSEEKSSRKLLLKVEQGEIEIAKPRKKLISKIELEIYFGDRMVIAGKNGCGKTSLLNLLINKKLKNFKYEFKEHNSARGLKFAYIDQNYRSINPKKSILDNILKNNKTVSIIEAKQVLARLLLNQGDNFNRKASDLSGGEVAKLIFAKEILKNPDLLILDEPTNNLDLESIEVVTKAINEFKGAVLAVSHDIEFLNQIKVNQAYLIKGRRLTKMKYSPLEKEEYYQELTRKLSF
ncbi:MAG: ATP-binding cassette domain-containing protein [Candidatus Moranbacteria bacterium]|nr:ATP-binding cassette domain-containing protein [Candidatus Moranbacteria bacterium]